MFEALNVIFEQNLLSEMYPQTKEVEDAWNYYKHHYIILLHSECKIALTVKIRPESWF